MRGWWLLWLVFWVCSGVVLAQDWPQWRGPDRSGEARSGAASPWPETLIKLWSVKTGAGLASPIVVGESAYLLTRDGKEEVVTKYRLADGGLVWQDRYAAPFFPNSQASSAALFPVSKGMGPFASPLFHDGKLYTLGVSRICSCYDAMTGALLWRNHFFKTELPGKPVYVCPPCGSECDELEFDGPGICETCRMPLNVKDVETSATFTGTWPNYYGAAASPLAAGGLIFIHVSQPDKGRLMALEAGSGKERWHWDGPAQVSSSPVLAEIHGIAQIVVLTRESVAGIALKSGRELWSFPLTSNAQIVTPIVSETKVVFATYRGPLTALDIRESGDVFKAEPAWENQDVQTQTSTPVLGDGVLFCHSTKRRGQIVTVDLESGNTLWQAEGNLGRHASVTALGQEVMLLGLNGELMVFKKNRDAYQAVQRYRVTEKPVWTMPIPIGKRILIKEADALTLWGR